MSKQRGFSMVEGLLVLLVIGSIVAVGIWVAASDSDDDDDTAKNDDSSQVVKKDKATIELGSFDVQVKNLEPLTQGTYEGWVVRGDTKTSFGTFNTDADGGIVGSPAYDGNLQDGDTVAISIEPSDDTDPEPSETIILSGEVSGGSADLAFPVDVSTFSGQFILGTPTTATDDDETAGVWFTSSGTDTLLNIPVAPAGWAYEGWAVVDGTPYTSGLFTDPSKADFFNGYSGPLNAPDKPGEDYITNLPGGVEGPLELLGSTIVVSIEPYQNGVDPTGDAPAQVKPLTADVAADGTDHTRYDLTVSTDTLPSGSVSSTDDEDA